jgi:glycosyltransferase involved in cell wall biosynthesis
MKPRLSSVVITLNAERTIGQCLSALAKVTDDIVIVDSSSRDATISICEENQARVFQRQWRGYGEGKNFGAKQCKSDWVLSIDADEVLSDDLITSINALDLKHDCVYTLDRITSLCGKWIRHSGWYPDWVIRLYHRSNSTWNQDLVHEKLEHLSDVDVIRLKGKLLHYSYPDLESYHLKLEKYALLAARQLHNQGRRSWWVMRILGPVARFIRAYFLKLGFLDGKWGWFLSVQQARMVYMRHRYLVELNRGKMK